MDAPLTQTMKSYANAALAAAMGALALSLSASAWYIRPAQMPRATADLAHFQAWPKAASLPASFDWRQETTVSPIRSQYIPQWCGSCWAQAVTSALADRVIIARQRASKALAGPSATTTSGASIMLSPQVLLDCGWDDGDIGSCTGGSWELAHKFMAETGITEDSCSPYLGADRNCLAGARMCYTCNSTGSCGPVEGARRFHVAKYGYLNTTEEMQQEMYTNGPIVCSMYSHTSPWHCYNGTGVIQDNTTFADTTHVISLLGWGVEDGVDYWLGRHSGGTTWGDEGYFKIQRGINTLGIEQHCGFATVADPFPTRNQSQITCEA